MVKPYVHYDLFEVLFVSFILVFWLPLITMYRMYYERLGRQDKDLLDIFDALDFARRDVDRELKKMLTLIPITDG